MIKLTDIIAINDPSQYKLHLAGRNEDWVSPLDEYVADPSNWVGWNQWKGRRDDWTREFIFSLMEFYPFNDAWLFGGVFRVVERREDGYILEEVNEYQKYVGRLILSFHRYQGMRGRAYYLESYIDQFTVREILPDRYSGETFPGYENVCHDFHVLEPIFKTEKSDWKGALSSVKGVYLISDKSNGRKYVGSAYGGAGIWSRWSCYIGTGHGWNDELTKIISEKELKYARENFRLSILEIADMATADDAVISREAHWKNALLSREYGYNRN